MANGDRKVFADSVTPLPAAEGPTHLGLMVAKARPETSKEQMTVVFSLALPDSAQADLQKMVAEGRTVSPAQLNKKYAADANDAKALTSWLKSQGFKIEKVSPDRTSVYAQYTVLVENRASVQKALESEGIPTAVHYPMPIHRQPAYTRWATRVECPASERLAEKVMSLPMHAYLDASTQDRIIDVTRRALKK
jgi:hypothetical protein